MSQHSQPQASTSSSQNNSVVYPMPTPGASLILAFRPSSTLIIGSGHLAASRAFSALETGSTVTILAHGGVDAACEELRWRFSAGQLDIVDWELLRTEYGVADDVEALEQFVDQFPGVSLACITDTISGTKRRSRAESQRIYEVLKGRNIPVNTTDIPELCDFAFTSTHRFADPGSGEVGPLQIGVTTNGQGCRLASRLRREVVAKLPADVGRAATNVGQLRALAKASTPEEAEEEEILEDSSISTPNRPVPSRALSAAESELESAQRRMKWVAQVSEYWPLSKLASVTRQEMDQLLDGTAPQLPSLSSAAAFSALAIHSFSPTNQKGRIFLVGSGPGHPSLLTLATHTVLTRLADVVLSDKLVPDAVLQLIPKHVEVRIARKFPGNAEAAQMEMMEAAVEAAKRGLNVVRLKQGDPVVYGRAGEEVLYFREHGFESLVIPGVSSALAAPTFAGIPVTQRGVAESFIVCTGVGRKGKEIRLPGYERGRTLVVLMGVARLKQVVEALVGGGEEGVRKRDGPAYPRHLPIAIIERASMPDQRVVASTLENIVQALESSGEQRPPGMILVGWSVLALWGAGDVSVLDEGVVEEGSGVTGEEEVVKKDEARVRRWLGEGRLWRVETGIDEKWDLV